jgi:hypothetical protein
MKLPGPHDPYDLLAKEFSAAAREEIRYDKATKRPYRVNHCFTVTQNGKQQHLWLDIDDNAPRHKMVMATGKRREQMMTKSNGGRTLTTKTERLASPRTSSSARRLLSWQSPTSVCR